MPRVFKMGPYLVYFWSDEREPLEPVHVHIHVKYQGRDVFVDLVKMEITKGALPKRQAVTLLAWCEHNKVVLMRNWKNRLKPGGIVRIPPPSWK